MASDKEPPVPLTEEELLVTWANSRVVRVRADYKGNKFGVPFQVFCKDDKLKLQRSIPVILFNHVWYICKFDKGQPVIGNPFVSVHDYDILGSDEQPIEGEAQHLSEEESSSSESDTESDELEQDPITQQVNQQIRNSPLNASQKPLPPHTATQHPTILQLAMTTTTTTSTSTTTATPATISAAYQKALNGQPPSGGGGGGGDGGGGGGGGRGGRGAPQQNIAPANDVKSMGKLPEVLTGDRTRADDFIEEVKAYLCLNADIAGFNSPMKKVAFTVTLMKGPEVAGWTRDIGTMLDGLNPNQDNVPAVWEQFLQEFSEQYQCHRRLWRRTLDRIVW